MSGYVLFLCGVARRRVARCSTVYGRVLLQMVFRHPVAEGIAGHFEEAAGFGDIAGGFLQCFFKHPLLQFLE